MTIDKSINTVIRNAIKLTQELIQIPSESSNGTATTPQIEIEIYRTLKLLCNKHNIPHEHQEALPERKNLLLKLPNPDHPKILITAHMDTVSGKGMPKPFSAEIKNGNIYGRGACDNKASLAVLFTVFIHLHNKPEKLQYDLTIAGTVDEECSMAGAATLARENQAGWDLCLAMEPSFLRPISCHIGVYRCRIVPPQDKSRTNAHQTIQLLHDINNDLQGVKQMVYSASHSKLGKATFSSTLIKQDKTTSLSRILVDIRLLPEHNPAKIHRAIQKAVGQRAVVIPLFTGLGIEADPKNSIIKKLQQSIAAQGITDELIAVPFPSDCSQLQGRGECLVWGPGDPQNAHQNNEFIAISQIEKAVLILHNFLTSSRGK